MNEPRIARAGTLIYIACPYSDPDPGVQRDRYYYACSYAASLTIAGDTVFCQIAHAVALVETGLISDTGFEFWRSHKRRWLDACSEVHALLLPGWESSRGMAWEIGYATTRRMPVRYIE